LHIKSRRPQRGKWPALAGKKGGNGKRKNAPLSCSSLTEMRKKKRKEERPTPRHTDVVLGEGGGSSYHFGKRKDHLKLLPKEGKKREERGSSISLTSQKKKRKSPA